jgi:inorganic pyrophosphatase
VNYGYLPGVIAPDGGGLDAYLLGVDEPVLEYAGRCIAIVHRVDDDDDKLVVVPEGTELTDDEIRAQTRFQEQFFESRIMRAAGSKDVDECQTGQRHSRHQLFAQRRHHRGTV